MDRESLRKLQGERLANIVKHTYENVEFYRKRMDEAGVKPSDIRSIDAISKLPFMQKQDLRDYYPFGTFAAPMKDIVRFHASSGTTAYGMPPQGTSARSAVRFHPLQSAFAWIWKDQNHLHGSVRLWLSFHLRLLHSFSFHSCLNFWILSARRVFLPSMSFLLIAI